MTNSVRGAGGRNRLALAAVMTVLLAVAACDGGTPTPTAITFPPTPTAITFPPTPTAITFPPTPTAIAFPPTATPSVIPSTTAVAPTPTPGTPVVPTSTPARPTPTASPEPPLTTTEIASRILPSVVRISVDTGAGQASGTSIVFDDTGKILTNWHVVDGAVTISVTKPDETVVLAELFRGDPDNDIALVVVGDASGLRPPLFGDSGTLRVGEDVVAIGHALGLAGPPTVSKGVVSALGRSLPNGIGGELTGLIQIDAAINSGNSGGPLINGRGEVIGVNTARLSTGDRIGFAISINGALETVDELIALGPVPPPGYLGIGGRTMPRAEAANLGLPITGGYLVQVVGADTPAEAAGIVPGDVIVQMDQTLIRNQDEFTQFLRLHPPGTEVRVFVWRLVPGSGWEPVALNTTLSTRQ